MARTQLVWFKRDLRVADHQPLSDAARHGPVLALYVYEPSIWGAGDLDASHLTFVNAALTELRAALQRLGGTLVLRVGEMPDVLATLVRAHDVGTVWAHEETSTLRGYARDRQVRAWLRAEGVPFNELPTNGVVRGLASRDGWSRIWERRMRAPMAAPPKQLRAPHGLDGGALVGPAELGLPPDRKRTGYAGGEREAHVLLQEFLHERGLDYRRAMSSPVTAFHACSRLSPHFTWGTLSVRQAYQALHMRLESIALRKRAGKFVDPRWTGSLSSFASRLRWRCHFMQKLEDEPALEVTTMCEAYEGVRPREPDAARFAAWCEGRTGVPLVDACMRALLGGSWLNFRMRSMLVSFASYDLWLDWRPTSRFLARHFLDYEPGIHYCQFQMQSGVTGINTIRLYNPWKQAEEHDPEGRFVKQWVPELAGVPTDYILRPHEMPMMIQQMSDCIIGEQYPAPIVEHAAAARTAYDTLWAIRQDPATRPLARAVHQKHGSRAESAAHRGL